VWRTGYKPANLYEGIVFSRGVVVAEPNRVVAGYRMRYRPFETVNGAAGVHWYSRLAGACVLTRFSNNRKNMRTLKVVYVVPRRLLRSICTEIATLEKLPFNFCVPRPSNRKKMDDKQGADLRPQDQAGRTSGRRTIEDLQGGDGLGPKTVQALHALSDAGQPPFRRPRTSPDERFTLRFPTPKRRSTEASCVDAATDYARKT